MTMNEQHILALICDARLKSLVQEGREIDIFEAYSPQHDFNTIEDAIDIVKYLETQQIHFSKEEIEHNYQSLLHKILF
jgi:hypothetical protein